MDSLLLRSLQTVNDDGMEPSASPAPTVVDDTTSGEKFIDGSNARIVATIFAVAAIVVSMYEIYKHLQHYSRPLLQRQVIRIILIVPIYAAGSLLSLYFPHGSLYFNTIRDIYEAYVIHSFLALMLDFPGGEPVVVLGIRDKPKLKHPIPFCFLPRMRLDHTFIQQCKRSTLQFVFIKPLTAFISVALMMAGEEYYESHAWQYTMLVVYNISYTSALYGLLLYYMATKHLLKGFHAVGKFAAVKIIVFATYYQSLLVTAIPGADTLGSSEKWNDFIICIEMFCFAVMHLYCFSHKEFLPGGVGMMNANRDDDDAPVNLKTDTTFSAAMSRAADVLSIKDVLEDATRNFSLRYGRYIMQGVEGGAISEGRADHVEANRPRGPPPVLPEIREVVVVKEKELGTDKESLFASAPDAIIQVRTLEGTVDIRKGGHLGAGKGKGKGKGGYGGNEEEEEDDSDPYGLVIAVQGASDATQLEVVEPVMDAHLQANVPRPHKKVAAGGRERGDTAGSFDADFSTIQRSDSKRSRAMSTSTGDNTHAVLETQIGALANASVASNKAALLAASAAAAASLVQAAKRPPLASDANAIDRTHSGGVTGASKGPAGVSHALSSRGVGRATSGPIKPLSAPATPQEKIKFAGDADAEEKEQEVLDNSFGAILSSDQASTVATDTIGQSVISPRDAWAPAFDDGFTSTKAAESLPVPKVIEASPVSLSDRQKKAQERLQALKIDASKLRAPAAAPSSNHSSPDKAAAAAVSVTADPSSWEFVPTSYDDDVDATVSAPSAATAPTATAQAAKEEDWTAAAPVVDFSQVMSVGLSDTAMPTNMGSFDADSATPALAAVSVTWDAPTVEFKTAPLALRPPPAAGTARRLATTHSEEHAAPPATTAINGPTATSSTAVTTAEEDEGAVPQRVAEHSFAPSDARLSFSPHHATTTAGHASTPVTPATLAVIQEVVATPPVASSSIALDDFDAPAPHAATPTPTPAHGDDAPALEAVVEEREEGEVTPYKVQHMQQATTIVREEDLGGQHHVEIEAANPFDEGSNAATAATTVDAVDAVVTAAVSGEERGGETHKDASISPPPAPTPTDAWDAPAPTHESQPVDAPVDVVAPESVDAAGVIELDTAPTRSPSPALPPPPHAYLSPFDAAYPYDIHGPPFSPPPAEVTMTSPVAALDFSSPMPAHTHEAATPASTHEAATPASTHEAGAFGHEGMGMGFEMEAEQAQVSSSPLPSPPGPQFTSPEVQQHVVDTPMTATSHISSVSHVSHGSPAMLLPASPPLFNTPTSVLTPVPTSTYVPTSATSAAVPVAPLVGSAHVPSQSSSRPSSFLSSDHHTPVLVSTKSTGGSSSSSSRRSTLDGSAALPFGVVPSMAVQPKREHTTASSSSLSSFLPVDTMPHASAASFATTPPHEATPTELSAADTGASASFVDDVGGQADSSPSLEAAPSVDPEVATDMGGFAHVVEDGVDEFTQSMGGRNSSAPATPVQPHDVSVVGTPGMTTPTFTPGAEFEWDMTPDASAAGGETPQDDFSF